jgi:hypothetical protein
MADRYRSTRWQDPSASRASEGCGFYLLSLALCPNGSVQGVMSSHSAACYVGTRATVASLQMLGEHPGQRWNAVSRNPSTDKFRPGPVCSHPCALGSPALVIPQLDASCLSCASITLLRSESQVIFVGSTMSRLRVCKDCGLPSSFATGDFGGDSRCPWESYETLSETQVGWTRLVIILSDLPSRFATQLKCPVSPTMQSLLHGIL